LPDDRDLYQAFHGAKLWALLPELYRAQDSDSFDRNGPLRELVNRIGVQAAILRRSLDRLWDDQSIETCDDWIIPYIGDLLATNLVPALPAREQRLDVAKTIYYRRRKGTLAVLEEIAANITGWDVKLVEFFRRLGRTRHLLDPPIGLPVTAGDSIDQLRQAEGLISPRSLSAAGGFADPRNAYGASRSRTAFDEFSHTADFRAGRGVVGWHDIPRLGVFLWRLISFGGRRTTPVFKPDHPDCFTFDPTGRHRTGCRPRSGSCRARSPNRCTIPTLNPALATTFRRLISIRHRWRCMTRPTRWCRRTISMCLRRSDVHG